MPDAPGDEMRGDVFICCFERGRHAETCVHYKPATDSPAETREDVQFRKLHRLLNAFGKAYHDYICADAKALHEAGARMDAASDAIHAYLDAATAATGIQRASGAAYVLVSPEMVTELSADWSKPVQIKVTHTAADGKLELIARRPSWGDIR